MRKRRPRVTPAHFAISSTCRCNCSITSGPSPRDLQDRLDVRHVAGIDARKRSVRQVAAYLMLQLVIAPIAGASESASESRLRQGYPRRRLCGRRVSSPCATTSITATSSSNVSILRNQSGHKCVPVGQQDFEQTPLSLAALNHTRSFDEIIKRGQCRCYAERGTAGPWRLRSS